MHWFPVSVESCDLRLFNIYVGMTSDRFLDGGALVCARNRTAGAAESAIVECVQPVLGRYLTIVNLVYSYGEPVEKQKYEKCLYLCEVEVYGQGKVKNHLFPA